MSPARRWPGSTLRAIVRPLLTDFDAEHVLDATIADLQQEWWQAESAGDHKHAKAIRWSAAWATLHVLVLLAARGGWARVRAAPRLVLLGSVTSTMLGIVVLAAVRPGLARHQQAFALVGLLACGAALAAPLRWWRRAGLWLAGFSVAALLAVHLTGVSLDGLRRWLALGPLLVMPAELLKPLLILAMASLLAGPVRRESAAVAMTLISAGLIAAQPDLANVIIISAASISMAIAARASRRSVLALFGGTVPCVAVAAMRQFGAGGSGWLDRAKHALFDGTPRAELHTDAILGAVMSRAGLAGLLLGLTLAGLVAVESVRLARRATDSHTTVVAAGVAALFVAQPVVRLLLGEGMTFLSFGGSALVAAFACVGLAAHAQGRGANVG